MRNGVGYVVIHGVYTVGTSSLRELQLLLINPYHYSNKNVMKLLITILCFGVVLILKK
jgi:hypothetical protein